ncbi:hypothetical protein ACKKBF_B04960 [Auxenochlorella protothecoides x Auxenochlorella symbiontica]
MAMEVDVPNAMPPWGQAPAPAVPAKAVTPSGNSYRQREATQFRGVTKTSGTNSGLEKFDVQFVFCDHGTKKHPKIYGFGSAGAAACAFDILTCKRALEKGRTVAGVLGSAVSLATNHPSTNYQNDELLTLLSSITRDDVIYGLKICAKKGYLLGSSLVEELRDGVSTAQREAAERGKQGEARQSYEPSAKAALGERKRRASGGGRGAAAAAAAAGPNPALASLGLPDGAGLGMLSMGAGAMDPATLAAALSAMHASTFQHAFLMQHAMGGPGPGAEAGPLGLGPARGGLEGAEAGSGASAPGGATPAAPGVVAPEPDCLGFLQEALRLAASLSPELQPALDLVRLWGSLQPGAKALADPPAVSWYYPSVLPMLHACADVPALLALCAQFWSNGTLRGMAAAAAGGAAAQGGAPGAQGEGGEAAPGAAGQAPDAAGGAEGEGDAAASAAAAAAAAATDPSFAAGAAAQQQLMQLMMQVSGMGMHPFLQGMGSLGDVPLALPGMEAAAAQAGADAAHAVAAGERGGPAPAGEAEAGSGPAPPLQQLMHMLDGAGEAGLEAPAEQDLGQLKRARLELGDGASPAQT